MGPELATGLSALVGVIVGAVASTGGQVYLEKKREAREADRAKQLVAGELLQAQMTFFAASKATHWPPIVHLPTSTWQEYRSRLPYTVDEDLFDQLVMTYALLELDRARFATGAELGPDTPLAASDAATLRQTGYHLGRLRRRLVDGGGMWPDEITRRTQTGARDR